MSESGPVQPEHAGPGSEAARLVDDHVTMASGVRLTMTRCAAGPVGFVLVHGLSSNRRLWDGVMRHLARHAIGTLSVDLRCHGESGCPPGPIGIATSVADLTDLLVKEGLDRPVLVGQSWGGNVVLQLGADRPDLTSGIACVDGGYIELRRSFPTWEACALVLAPPVFSRLTLADGRALFANRHPDWDAWAIDASLANFRLDEDGFAVPRLPRQRHMELLRDLWDHRPSELYGQLRIPLLLLLAADPADPRPDKRTAVATAEQRTRDIHVHWFDPADHDVHAQHPVIVAEELRHFLTATSASRR